MIKASDFKRVLSKKVLEKTLSIGANNEILEEIKDQINRDLSDRFKILEQKDIDHARYKFLHDKMITIHTNTYDNRVDIVFIKDNIHTFLKSELKFENANICHVQSSLGIFFAIKIDIKDYMERDDDEEEEEEEEKDDGYGGGDEVEVEELIGKSNRYNLRKRK